MDEALVFAVLALGFPEVRVRKAVLAGMRDLQQTVDWVRQHDKDAGIDDTNSMVGENSFMPLDLRQPFFYYLPTTSLPPPS